MDDRTCQNCAHANAAVDEWPCRSCEFMAKWERPSAPITAELLRQIVREEVGSLLRAHESGVRGGANG